MIIISHALSSFALPFALSTSSISSFSFAFATCLESSCQLLIISHVNGSKLRNPGPPPPPLPPFPDLGHKALAQSYKSSYRLRRCKKVEMSCNQSLKSCNDLGKSPHALAKHILMRFNLLSIWENGFCSGRYQAAWERMLFPPSNHTTFTTAPHHLLLGFQCNTSRVWAQTTPMEKTPT